MVQTFLAIIFVVGVSNVEAENDKHVGSMRTTETSYHPQNGCC